VGAETARLLMNLILRGEARRRRAEGATLKELAKSYNVGRAKISRLAAARP